VTDLPPVLRAAYVHRTPDDAFRLFTDHVGAWWPLATLGVFGGRSSLAFEDGRLVERALDGTRSVWGSVLAWDPPHRLALSWHPGLSDGPAGRVEVVFTPDGDGTRIELRHDGWAAFGEAAAAHRRSYDGPSAWGAVLDQFADLAGRGPGFTASAGAEAVARLADGYDAFYAEALAGGFGPPAPGEWSAEQVVAHVALNDVALAAVARALVQRRPAVLDNAAVNDLAVLGAFVQEHGRELPGLVAAGRALSATLLALLTRLEEEHLETPVPSRLQDHGQVVVDAELPLSRLLLVVQPQRHLPAHTDQLRALRGRRGPAGGVPPAGLEPALERF
jgi:uncharacterized protein YndB with AHSA1/START domain